MSIIWSGTWLTNRLALLSIHTPYPTHISINMALPLLYNSSCSHSTHVIRDVVGAAIKLNLSR